jgi:hypothetical protein
MSRAGGKLGNINVMIMTRKKPAAQAAPNVLFDICKECVRNPFFTLYEFRVLILKFILSTNDVSANAAIQVGLLSVVIELGTILQNNLHACLAIDINQLCAASSHSTKLNRPADLFYTSFEKNINLLSNRRSDDIFANIWAIVHFRFCLNGNCG